MLLTRLRLSMRSFWSPSTEFREQFLAAETPLRRCRHWTWPCNGTTLFTWPITTSILMWLRPWEMLEISTTCQTMKSCNTWRVQRCMLKVNWKLETLVHQTWLRITQLFVFAPSSLGAPDIAHHSCTHKRVLLPFALHLENSETEREIEWNVNGRYLNVSSIYLTNSLHLVCGLNDKSIKQVTSLHKVCVYV